MPSKYFKLVICLYVHEGNILLFNSTLIQNMNRRKLSIRPISRIFTENYEHDADVVFVAMKLMSLSSLCSCIFHMLCF
jgi:hypothetical protein